MKRERLEDVRSRLRGEALRRGINPRDVDLLLSDALGKPLPYLISHGETEIDPAAVEEQLGRRYRGEPLQYIRGRTEFFSRDFYVDRRVLIPRPETEILVEETLAEAARGARVIDIGTGSGCIAISLERERPDLNVVAIDLSLDALAVADVNRRRLDSRVALVASDLLRGIRGRFDIVVSNPPYIPAAEVPSLATEVSGHEPHMALTPGRTGTEAIERILQEAGGATVLLEIGFGQEEAVRGIAGRFGFDVERVVDDLAGIPRVVVLSPHGE